MTAMKCYFTYAQEQFAAAADDEVAGSMALRALGKLHDALAGKGGPAKTAAAPKAVVYYQAALLAFPENVMAANDLGVLLARSENYSAAREMLEYSLHLNRRPVTLRNLAAVYRRLERMGDAERAEGEAARIERAEIARRGGPPAANRPAVRWVEPRTFTRTSRGAPHSLESPPASAQAAGRPVESGRLPPAQTGPRSRLPTRNSADYDRMSRRSRTYRK